MDQILILEDDRALSQGIRLALGQADRQFLQAYTLREAQDALASHTPQLVILDLNLPTAAAWPCSGNCGIAPPSPC